MWQGMEKRKFPRAEFPCKIVAYLPGARTFLTHTENIGCGGVRVLLDENLELSSFVGLTIFFDSGRNINCRAKVVWTLEVKNPVTENALLYDTGLEFADLNEIDGDIIKTLVKVLLEKQKQK